MVLALGIGSFHGVGEDGGCACRFWVAGFTFAVLHGQAPEGGAFLMCFLVVGWCCSGGLTNIGDGNRVGWASGHRCLSWAMSVWLEVSLVAGDCTAGRGERGSLCIHELFPLVFGRLLADAKGVGGGDRLCRSS